MNLPFLVAVDWGTSALRGAKLDPQGKAVEERSFDRGILTVPAGQFPSVFEACFGDWLATPGTLCLMSGMVGSQQGWLEAPYCTCPAGFAEVNAQLTWVEPGRIGIVPGLVCDHGGIPDVMRGEETQIFGALQSLGRQDALMVLPGTHSKWVHVQAGRIQSFSTFMTGEFFALLRQHSILSRTLPSKEAELDTAAFDQGVAWALRSKSLLHTAFSARTLSLFERMPSSAMLSYLSGLVIGEELRAQNLPGGTEVILVGSESLMQRYQRAFALQHFSTHLVGAEATWAGLWAMAQTLRPDGAVPS